MQCVVSKTRTRRANCTSTFKRSILWGGALRDDRKNGSLADYYGGRAFSQKRWSDLCCDFEKEEEKNNFSSKIRKNILKP